MSTKPLSTAAATTLSPPHSPLTGAAARLRSPSPQPPPPPPAVAPLEKPPNGKVLEAKLSRETSPPPSSPSSRILSPPPHSLAALTPDDLRKSVPPPPVREPEDTKKDATTATAINNDDSSSSSPPDPNPIDMDIFTQILELDEEDFDFSSGMVDAFFTQADSTFDDMDKALQSENLAELSSLGHFLKGSSAALGITKVQNTCEEIQYYGKREDYKAGRMEVSEKVALKSIEVCVRRGKGEYGVARKWLEAWFLERGKVLGGE